MRYAYSKFGDIFWSTAIAPPLGQSVNQYLFSVNLESASTAVESFIKCASGLGCVSQTWQNNNNKTNN